MTESPVSIELLYRALESKFGIELVSNNPELLRQKLYAIRREAKNPDFECLVFKPSTSQPDTRLWIVKQPPKE